MGYEIADSLDSKTRATAKSLIYFGIAGDLVSARQQDRRHYAQFFLLGIMLLHTVGIEGIIRKIKIWV